MLFLTSSQFLKEMTENMTPISFARAEVLNLEHHTTVITEILFLYIQYIIAREAKDKHLQKNKRGK